MHFVYPLPVVPLVADGRPKLRLHRRTALHPTKRNTAAEVARRSHGGLYHAGVGERGRCRLYKQHVRTLMGMCVEVEEAGARARARGVGCMRHLREGGSDGRNRKLG